MIISIRLKNFFSLKDDCVLDFTADMSDRKSKDNMPENLVTFGEDRFVKIIGIFGSNAAGKSNIIKAIDFCRSLVIDSHLNNEGYRFSYEPFKFDKDHPSEFEINFVTEGVEYLYGFKLYDGKIKEESLYHYPNHRKARIFIRTDYDSYTFGKGLISRPGDIVANTGATTLFLSRASSMNREIAAKVYRFFLNEIAIITIGAGLISLKADELEKNKGLLLKAFEVSDSDIVDIKIDEDTFGNKTIQSFHKEDPSIAFDFIREESEGTKRLLSFLLILLKQMPHDTAIFIDEFDLKLHLRLAQFLLDVVRANKRMQLVFTSHNPALIDNKRLRPEQIVFVTKAINGSSEFVPLSDYDGVDSSTDVEKWYRIGRFDAVPYIGDIFPVISETLVEDESKEV